MGLNSRHLLRSFAFALLVPSFAWAAPSKADEQRAQSLFDAARTLMKVGDYAKACPMLEESQRLDPGGGTLLNLAACHEGEQRIATAYAEYTQALVLAQRDARKDREQTAREHLGKLAPMLPRLVVRTTAALPPGASAEFDGKPVATGFLDAATPVDPGAHRLVVSAPGYTPFVWEGSIDVGRSRELDVPALVALAQPGAVPVSAPVATPAATVQSPAAPAPAAQVPPAPAPAAEAPKRSSVVPTVLYVSAGALAVGSVLSFVGASDARNTASDKCIAARSYCTDQDGIDAASRAYTLSWLGVGLASGAAVAVLAGLVIDFTGGSAPAKAALRVGPTQASLQGTF